VPVNAHRVTYTYAIYEGTGERCDGPGKSSYRKVPQFWHWYTCASCGDEWEMYREDIDYPKRIFWCPCCRAKGQTPNPN